MLKIYLDTSHLQKWQRKKLKINEVKFLDKLKLSGQVQFVLSLRHLAEISDGLDKDKMIKLGGFLDTLPIIWIAPPISIQWSELDSALNNYNKLEKSNICLFSNGFSRYFDLFEQNASILLIKLFAQHCSVENLLSELTTLKGISMSLNRLNNLKETMKNWVETNVSIVSRFPNEKWKSEVLKKFKKYLKGLIIDLSLSEKKYSNKDKDEIFEADEFCNWLVNHPSIIPGIWFVYLVIHGLIRAGSAVDWKTGHFGDLDHLIALPYVDYLTVDREIYSYASKAIKTINSFCQLNLENKIFKSLTELESKISI